ncbi:MAG: zinc-binding alcohol dehydrogenase [Saprospiraceae bacterium]|nr:zinc-binding alcohol dehydrogenase [Saprospiraceae bacterium]
MAQVIQVRHDWSACAMVVILCLMGKRNAHALWHEHADSTVVRPETLDQRDGLTVLRASYSLISTGTERMVAAGQVPPQLHLDMEVPYMGGDLSLPVKYGYSLTGTMEQGPGTLWHVMHPHQDVCLVDPADCFEVPPGIPAKRATLASNLETALNALWDAMLLPGERVLIAGFGLIGSLVARLASGIKGIELLISEPNARRARLCSEMGFQLLPPEQTAVFPFDVAFHTSGTAAGLQQCLDLIGLEGRVVELSWYGQRETTLQLGGDFHSLRKRLFSSQVSRIPPHMRARWTADRRKRKVFDLLADPEFDAHITHTVSLEEAAALFNNWRKSPPEGLGYCIQYE